jgi:haloalkane dehalogenase
VLAVLLATSLLIACAAGSPRRSDALPGPVLRTPEARFAALEGYPFAPRHCTVGGTRYRPLRMHYVDEGPRRAAPVVLLHGQPSWSYLYRRMIPPLAAAGHRVIAPDLIGYGRSDKPAKREAYSYARHVEWLTRCLEAVDVRAATLVVHDWGGLLGFRIVAAQPGRFARLVVLNTSLNDGSEMETPRFKAGFDRWLEYLRTAPDIRFSEIVRAQTATELSPAVLAGYDAPFPSPELQAGPRAMSALIPRAAEDPQAQHNREIRAGMRGWRKPVLIAFSADADRLHPGQHALFSSLFAPEVIWRDVSVPDSKHFLQEDKGPELAALIDEFIDAT